MKVGQGVWCYQGILVDHIVLMVVYIDMVGLLY